MPPTPELWTRCLPHRTQILYAADVALVCSLLELAPGCAVLESGTGSGALTHALARAVAPGGRVDTFEFHQGRADAARAEFERHGLADVVQCHVRDVQSNGFGPGAGAGDADAVFLDLPAPWLAVPSAATRLRPDGVLASFSPCVEQVQRTCRALADAGFGPPATHELLLREHRVAREALVTDVLGREGKGGSGAGGGGAKRGRGADDAGKTVVARPMDVARGHTGYLTFARRAVD